MKGRKEGGKDRRREGRGIDGQVDMNNAQDLYTLHRKIHQDLSQHPTGKKTASFPQMQC